MKFRRLRFQQLEHRYALAGNVTAVIVDGDLFLTGDASGNELRVNQMANGDEQITGMNGTTINGSSTFPVAVSGLTGDIFAQMLGGNDVLRITKIWLTGGPLPGGVTANLGTGDDSFQMEGPVSNNGPIDPFPVGGSVVVYGRAGNDTIRLDRVKASGDILVYGNEGDDDVTVEDATGIGTVITGQLLIDVATGDDTVNIKHVRPDRLLVRDPIGVARGADVSLESLQIVHDAEIYLSIQNDTVSMNGTRQFGPYLNFLADHVIIHTGNGDDLVDIDEIDVNDLSVYTGDGNEGGGIGYGVLLTNLNIANQLWLETGAGLDNVLLEGSSIVHVRVYGGLASDGVIVQNLTATDAVFDTYEGDDVLGIHSSSFAVFLIALLGSGNDWLVVSNDDVDVLATFNGGSGSNQYSDFGGNTFAKLNRTQV